MVNKVFEKIKKIDKNTFLIVRVAEKGSSFDVENFTIKKDEVENQIIGLEKELIEKKDLLKQLKNVK